MGVKVCLSHWGKSIGRGVWEHGVEDSVISMMEEVTGETFIMRSFIICKLHQIFLWCSNQGWRHGQGM
jgi:hypothetical protein